MKNDYKIAIFMMAVWIMMSCFMITHVSAENYADSMINDHFSNTFNGQKMTNNHVISEKTFKPIRFEDNSVKMSFFVIHDLFNWIAIKPYLMR